MGSATGGKTNDAVKAIYADWLKNPKEARVAAAKADKSYPGTREAFSKKYHVNRATLWRWEQDPDFKREVANEALGLLSAEELAKMITVMKCKAMDGNVQAFNALMKLAGVVGDNNVGFEDKDEYYAHMTDAELEELASEGVLAED